MSIDELKRFFAYEKDERAHIADMLELLESRHQAILKQRAALEEAYMQCCANCTCIAIFSAVSKPAGRTRHWGEFTMARIFEPTIGEDWRRLVKIGAVRRRPVGEGQNGEVR